MRPNFKILPLIGLCCFTLTLISCAELEKEKKIKPERPETIPNEIISDTIELDLQKFFNPDSIEGHFSLYNLNKNAYFIYDKEAFKQAYSPASTFKIFNTLMALETKVVEDTNETFIWDGKDRGWSQWNKNHNLRTAIKYSALWVFQDIAKRIFAKDSNLYQTYLIQSQYGNQKLSDQQDLFWLDNSLQISAKQQLEFLKKFYQEDLPFQKENMAMGKQLIKVKQSNQYKLYGKTGLAIIEKKYLGWYIGFVETQKDTVLFCTQVKNTSPIESIGSFRNKYINTTLQILNDLRYLQESKTNTPQ